MNPVFVKMFTNWVQRSWGRLARVLPLSASLRPAPSASYLALRFSPLYCFSSTQRNLSTTVECWTKRAIREQAMRRTERYMKRTVDILAGHASKKKTQWSCETGTVPGVGSSPAVSRPVSGGNERRARQLSVVFGDYITNMLTTGEVCPELLDLQLQVTQVMVLPDLSQIQVLWLSSGEESRDEQILQLLPQAASQLRSALTSLRVIGNVPPIRFVKDRTAARLQEVERLLQVADMGPDEVDGSTYSEPCFELEESSTTKKEVASQRALQENISSVARKFNELEFTGTNVENELPQGSQGDVDVGGSVLNSNSVNVYRNSFEGKNFSRYATVRSDIYGLKHDVLVEEVLVSKRITKTKSSNRQD